MVLWRAASTILTQYEPAPVHDTILPITKDNYELFRNLLRTALNTAKEMGCLYMTFFCNQEEEDAAKEAGFLCVDEYVCYKTHLI